MGTARTGPRSWCFDDRGLDRLYAKAHQEPPRPRTYQEIADACGVSDTAIRLVCLQALKKLRHPAIIRKLRDE
jgi:DNA-directed RNA polymerase sigma subunit (sigma70/sigma32)